MAIIDVQVNKKEFIRLLWRLIMGLHDDTVEVDHDIVYREEENNRFAFIINGRWMDISPDLSSEQMTKLEVSISSNGGV